MKSLLILILLFLVGYVVSAQNNTQYLGLPNNTVIVRGGLHSSSSLKVPVVADTSHALSAGIDSLGLVIQIRGTGEWYKRDTVSTGGHIWRSFTPTLKKVHDSVYINSSYSFRDSVRWGVTRDTPVLHSTANIRNDGVSMIKLASGRLVMGWTSFFTGADDNDSATVRVQTSDDNGRTWQNDQLAIPIGTSVFSGIPSFYFNPTKDTLNMLYFRQNTTSTAQIYRSYCVNFNSNTMVWSSPTLAFGSGNDYYVPAADRVFISKKGVYFYPLNIHISGILQSSTGRYDGYMLRSQNGGATWDTIPGIRIISPDTLCAEGGLFQTDENATFTDLSPIYYYFRTRSNQVYMSVSTDGAGNGTSYGSPLPTGLFAPNSTTTMVYDEKRRTLIAAHNLYFGSSFRTIMQMSVKHFQTSRGITADAFSGQWHAIYRIDSSSGRQYIEPSILISDNEILVTYSDFNAAGDSSNIKIAHIPIYFAHGEDNTYLGNIVLNKTMNSGNGNWIELYDNGLDPTNNYFKVSNQTAGNSFFLPWFTMKTQRTSGQSIRWDSDVPVASTGQIYYYNGTNAGGSIGFSKAFFALANADTIINKINAAGSEDIIIRTGAPNSQYLAFSDQDVGVANGYSRFRNVTSSGNAHALWLDIKTNNTGYGLYITPSGALTNGALWLDPSTSGGAVASTVPLLKLTNNGTNRFYVYGDGTIKSYGMAKGSGTPTVIVHMPDSSFAQVGIGDGLSVSSNNLVSITNSVSAASTLTLSTASDYIFSGTTAVWTLPAVSGNTNRRFYIKNRGSGNLTINSNAGGNDLYDTSAVSTISVSPGGKVMLFNDGTYFVVE